jgi:hypothetical protein
MDWTDFFTGIASAGSSIATAVIGPRTPQAIPGNPGAVYLPSAATGSIVSTGGVLGGIGGSSSTLLIILLGVVLIFALRK